MVGVLIMKHELKKVWPFVNPEHDTNHDVFIVLTYEAAVAKRRDPHEPFEVTSHIGNTIYDGSVDRRRSFGKIDDAVAFFAQEIEFWRADNK
jgi:hypothetical protein